MKTLLLLSLFSFSPLRAAPERTVTDSAEKQLVSINVNGKTMWLCGRVMKDKGSALTVCFMSDHAGFVIVAAKGYKVGQFSYQWHSNKFSWEKKKVS